MATNKERIEALEAGLGGVQDGMQQPEDTEEDRLVAWELFEEELWARFGPTKCENFDEALTKVRQIGSLRDYQKEFERLGNRVHGWSQKALVGSFMGGLRSEISETICDKLGSHEGQTTTTPKANFTPPLPIRLALPTTSKASHVKRLSWEEMQRRRAKGLCFNYDDKFTSAHRCKGPQILLLEGSIDDDLEGDIKEAKIDIPSDPEISLHALTGWTTTKTMRVTAKIGTHDIVVLIDSGSTHNFISDKVAALLHLLVVPTTPFHVRVANDQPLKCQGRFDNIHILLQGIPFSITFYSLPLTSLDLVLGVQWFEQLGSVVCDWKRMTMEFQWANKPRLLQGSNTCILQQASLEAISKDMRHTSSIFAICLQPPDAPYQTIQLDMQTLIEAFTAIFEKPQQLPPVCEIDHCIPLKKGTKPINVRPYRYAYFQKAEIEKQVLDMLKLGLIRPSTNPFSFLKFYIQTDQWSLKYLLEQRMVTPEQQKWVAKLLGYDYEILYKLGCENSAADALSRVPGSQTLNALFVSQAKIWEEIKIASIDDAYMARISKLAAIKSGLPYTNRHGLIFYKNRVVVPPQSHIPNQLLHEFHDSPLGGHSGVLRTYKVSLNSLLALNVSHGE
ncbi:hypothetical protein AAG906_025635 [Vitis piasezkii]